MKKKLFISVILLIISFSMISCEKKVSTGDPEWDDAIEELQEILKEDEENYKVNLQDEEEMPNIKIKEAFLLNEKDRYSRDRDYIAIYVEQDTTDDNLVFSLKGTNSGEEKKLSKMVTDLTSDFTRLNLPLLSEYTGEKFLKFKLDWDGYEEYILTVKKSGSDELVNERSYIISKNDLKKISKEDLCNLKAQELFKAVDYSSDLKYKNLSFKYLGANLVDGIYKINFSVTNEGNIPSDKFEIINAYIITKDGETQNIYNKGDSITYREAINPGETIDIIYEHELIEEIGDRVPEDEFIFRCEVTQNISEEGIIFYFKTKA